MTAAKMLKGNWSARWGAWAVGLRSHGSMWSATVWRWEPGTSLSVRREIDDWDGFKTVEEAVAWACIVMRNDGAKVFVVGRPDMTLESMLAFAPAPEAVHAS